MNHLKLPPYIDPSNAIGYYRVSRKNQEKYGNSLVRYHEDLINFGVLEENLFFDVQSGGEEREGLNKALEKCSTLRQEFFNQAIALVYPEPSRLQRSVLIGEKVKDFVCQNRILLIEANTGKI